MNGFLLDTNVISELVKPRPEANVTAWIEGTGESLLYLSVLTLGEIRRGIAVLLNPDSIPSMGVAVFNPWQKN